MNFFVLLEVSVLLGAVYCADIDCYNRKVTSCAQRVLDNLETEPDSCPIVLQQSKCVLSAAIDCQMGFIMKAQKADLFLRRVCSGEFKPFEDNKQCFGAAFREHVCHTPIEKIMSNKTTRKEVLKAQKEACTQVYWFQRCIISRVEEHCGEPKQDIFYIVFNPLFDLYLAYCKDVLIPADENSDHYLTFGLPSIFELIVDVSHYD
ncbi:unnamed protein product [Larinioides sclopetarius]|uniref:Uncharacterized protein n=1 Tax=Larinioides sclopetarius TaxID=280406 RepID=A0AAV2BLC8_9ARAC